jgi:hypothetical protein
LLLFRSGSFPSRRCVPYSAKEVATLLDGFDPFTLVFGFEICRDRLAEGDRGFDLLGAKFLRRLFSDERWLKQRCEVFAAGAVVTMVHLRASANAKGVKWTPDVGPRIAGVKV